MTLPRLIILLAIAAIVAFMASCSSVTGGSSHRLDDHTTLTTGATATEGRTTTVTVTPAGAVEVRSGSASATTQPSHTETTRTETATTQPSASSTTGFPKLTTDAAGNTSLSFDVDQVAHQYAALWPVIGILLLAGVGFYFTGHTLGAVACVGLAVATAWMPGTVAWLSVLGVVAWLIIHNRNQLRQLVTGNEKALAALPADLAAAARGKMAEAHDAVTKALVRRVKGKP